MPGRNQGYRKCLCKYYFKYCTVSIIGSVTFYMLYFRKLVTTCSVQQLVIVKVKFNFLPEGGNQIQQSQKDAILILHTPGRISTVELKSNFYSHCFALFPN